MQVVPGLMFNDRVFRKQNSGWWSVRAVQKFMHLVIYQFLIVRDNVGTIIRS